MTDNTIQPYIANTAAAIIRRDSNTAWDSAVEKFAKPRPSPQYVIWAGTYTPYNVPSEYTMLTSSACAESPRGRVSSASS